MNRATSAIVVACLILPGLLTAQSGTKSSTRSSTKSSSERPVWPDEGPRTWAPRPTSPEITANDLRTRLYQFADDSMAGRRIGEPGNFKGTEYIAREFKRLGLKPAGDNGTYFQLLAYGPLGYESAALQLTAGGRNLTPSADWIPSAPTGANGLASSVDLSNVPTVFAGTWGDTTVMLDASLLRGRVAVFLAAPMAAPVEQAAPRISTPLPSCADVPDKFGAAAAAAVEAMPGGARTTRTAAPPPTAPARDERALKAGAVAILVVGLDDMSQSARSAVLAGRMMMEPSALPNASATMAGAVISPSAAAALFGKPVGDVQVGTEGQAVTARWNYAWRPSASPARNVVAILPGSDPARAGEYVLVGAHNDHVGTTPSAVDHDSLRAVNTVTRRQGANDPACIPTADQHRRIDSLIRHARTHRAPRMDSIMNGADDDGSGTVVLLEIAERFATEKPARSILFVSHQGEEAGLLGSKWFVDHPTVPLKDIVAAHNMDMVGKGRVEQVKFGGPTSIQMLGARRLSREFGDIIDSVNAVRKETMAIDKTWEVSANPLNRFCRSDQVNYVNHDIPVTYFSLGYAQDYHQVTDEPQYIDYEHAARVGRFIHDIMMAVSERKERPFIAGPDPTMPSCRR